MFSTTETPGKEARHWTGNVIDGKYLYVKDLFDMESCSSQWEAPPFVKKITSPLTEKLHDWATLTHRYHPDKELTAFLLNGLEKGFRIGYASDSKGVSVSHNLLSCLEHPVEVQSYIDKECMLGRVLGPFPREFEMIFVLKIYWIT